MKALIYSLLLVTLGAATAKADPVSIAFDQPTQIGVGGQTLEFFGTITNTSGGTIFLNSDGLTLIDPNLVNPSLATNDQFFNTVPISLAPGESSGDIELFDVILASPFTDPFTTYFGEYTLVGGADGGAQDNLTTASFAVSAVPEPPSIYLMLSGLTTLVPLARRMRKQVA